MCACATNAIPVQPRSGGVRRELFSDDDVMLMSLLSNGCDEQVSEDEAFRTDSVDLWVSCDYDIPCLSLSLHTVTFPQRILTRKVQRKFIFYQYYIIHSHRNMALITEVTKFVNNC